eukprot:scaffold8454_cov113-Skeletonema_marinoi.AAC.4
MTSMKTERYTPACTRAQREVEALVGGVVLKTIGKAAQNIALTKSRLVAKEVYLPQCGYTMYYHEREAVVDGKGKFDQDKRNLNQPTILFFHGITQRSEDLSGFIASLDIPPHVRILCPEQMGHGRDIDNRLRADPDNYTLPTHHLMLESNCEFLDVVNCSSNTNSFGISLGGAACYYLQHHRPDIIKRTVLVSPAILCCVDKGLVNGIREGTNNFCCFESRHDVKLLMRDLSTGRDDYTREKWDPVPQFFLESVYRQSKKGAPAGHFRALLLNLLANTDSPFSAMKDVDADSHRLVMWPEKDRIINNEEGKRFFEVSSSGGDFASKSSNTEFESITDCGHVFHSDGRGILDIIKPRVRDYLLDFMHDDM